MLGCFFLGRIIVLFYGFNQPVMVQDTQVKAIDVVRPEEIQNDVNSETAHDCSESEGEDGEVLLKLCFGDFYKAC